MLEHNALTAGVTPGGLWNQSDIKLLICYVLSSVGEPLSKEDVVLILQDKNLANYFEINDAFEAQVSLGNVEKTPEGLYVITENGRKISETLDTRLPLSVRDKALESAVRLMSYARNRREHKVEIKPVEKGVEVTCHISSGEKTKKDLMTITVLVGDAKQAAMVEETFHKNPQRIYQALLCAMTGDMDLAETFFGDEIREKKAEKRRELERIYGDDL